MDKFLFSDVVCWINPFLYAFAALAREQLENPFRLAVVPVMPDLENANEQSQTGFIRNQIAIASSGSLV